MCISTLTPSRNVQKIANFARNSKIVGPQYGICFVSLFWRQEFRGGAYTIGKFVYPCRGGMSFYTASHSNILFRAPEANI